MNKSELCRSPFCFSRHLVYASLINLDWVGVNSNMNKKQKIGIKVTLALVLTLISVYLFAPWQYGLFYLKPLPSSVSQQLEHAVATDIEGMVLYIDKKGEQPRQYAAGWHDRKKQIPAKPDALFKIGSIAKLYTNVLLTKLHFDGVISLDKTLADYLPSVAQRFDNADEITLKMMIKHRSGLPNYTDNPNFDWSCEYSEVEVIQLAADMSASFNPGSDYQYSNTNYFLLRKIMSEQLGHDYFKAIESEILAPLGLENTFYSVNDVEEERLMGGYHIGYEQNFNLLEQGVVATAQDVAVFIRALNEGTIFTPEEDALYSQMYGREHTGWVLGHSSIARYEEEHDTVIIQFTNTTGNDIVLLTKIIYSRIVDIIKRDSLQP